MRNDEKAELREIVRGIPADRLRSPIAQLWRRYAPWVTYGTFKKYVRALRGAES